ncbi:HDOD domain-containing protein [Duganella sp. BJB488]|uniref:HDOD domain-containing protein n=1 Tax=Duganella vulcania TaxID=2692166 RepID=A0A845HPS2_9BURK|nr:MULTISPECIES: HDOD domain-containing protein [Duganella]MCU6498749.1 HDOD domain-containing protein [Rugamonas sp. A1-17]MYN20798.1 HDOD domain-containing protein [Duganella vulcania]NVD73068.1 HDOD domain-containing protein [Duganella sp. BJB1802]RFP09807.1 HDOD domain-containing protein [Duganella sp. BJB489]RFP13333.1 HDOD domain-containing protein [Duganella sp. BJB488]
MKLDALFQNPTALPTAPKVVEELISSFDKASVSTEEIAKKLSTDPVLSAKLLRLANSAYYHVSRSIGTVEDAVLMLGFVTVRTLVISSGLVSGFKTVPGLDLKQFWRYSLHTAVSAKWIAKKTKENTDLAFTIGMMHAIGQLVIHSAMAEQAMALDKVAGPLDPRRLDAEQASFGFTFADVGAELAKRWKFPLTFSETILAFPEPHHNGELNRLAAVVSLAAWRARVEQAQLSDDEIEACYPADLAEELGLDDNALIDEMPSPDELSAGLEELVK